MTHIAIVGSGLIGRAWATVFCAAGMDVTLYDPVEGVAVAAVAFVGESLREQESLGLVADAAAKAEHARAAGTLREALDGADLVQESGPERLEDKARLFAEMDALAAPTTILASSTSFIKASDFSKDVKGRARCLVAHPVNPPHLVPIVELAPAPWTDPDVTDRARAIYAAAGQSPVTLKREVDGFILNRLQAVLLAEAFRMVAAGVCSPQDLDTTIKDGLGLRWSFMGPFETIELNAPGGVADYCARYTGFYKRLADDGARSDVYRSPNMDRVIAAWPHEASPDRLARRTRWRNERLAALAAHKRDAAKDA